jgi:hypothetical protein
MASDAEKKSSYVLIPLVGIQKHTKAPQNKLAELKKNATTYLI